MEEIERKNENWYSKTIGMDTAIVVLFDGTVWEVAYDLDNHTIYARDTNNNAFDYDPDEKVFSHASDILSYGTALLCKINVYQSNGQEVE